ncbi:MAG: sulfatase-like hydrolase/transferase, partial [Gammaproteobacteria bacterium]|nr:sulfatase-like hydrolase/transferase [Gammaproteobacteria bacterium]
MKIVSACNWRARLPKIAASVLFAAGCADPGALTENAREADAPPAGGPIAHAAAPPNIVVILADDLGYGDIGAYGANRIRTPNIDRLAASGLRFTQGYASANVCSPSRAGLMTGRYAIRSGLAFKVVDAESTHGLPEAEETLGELVKRRGYRTLYVGKWHLGNFPEHLPLKHGFD